MTHTLHRAGKPESLKDDFVVFAMSAKLVNAEGSGEKMKRFIEIVERHQPINFGDMKTGNFCNTTREEIYKNVQDTSIVHFVFADREVVAKIIKDLKQASLGISVVISGLIDETDRICEQVGLQMHTVEYSGGIFGQIEHLPEQPILEVMTMCGHGMVAKGLVREMVKQVKARKMTAAEAAMELTKPCQCGVFNPKRAEKLIEDMIGIGS